MGPLRPRAPDLSLALLLLSQIGCGGGSSSFQPPPPLPPPRPVRRPAHRLADILNREHFRATSGDSRHCSDSSLPAQGHLRLEFAYMGGRSCRGTGGGDGPLDPGNGVRRRDGIGAVHLHQILR